MDCREREFRQRIERFRDRRHVELSIQLRVTSGCFHRKCSPEAYRIIDDCISSHPTDEFAFFEHESGPEILVSLAITTAGITLAKSVLDLITTIIKARTEDIEKEVSPDYPLVLMVRSIGADDKFHENEVLRIDGHAPPPFQAIEDGLSEAINRIAKDRVPLRGVARFSQRPTPPQTPSDQPNEDD
ncbi:MAG: hypothetical protein ACC652_13975 [Acidimicrobiales bacterium]